MGEKICTFIGLFAAGIFLGSAVLLQLQERTCKKGLV